MKTEANPEPLDSHRGGRWFNRQVERKGLRPRYAAYLIVAFWGAAVIVFGVLERLVDPDTFDSVWLGMWWALQTVTTVGYGDVVPQQTAGKIIASFLLLGGLSMLAVITGAITSSFVTRAQNEQRAAGRDPVIQKLLDMTEQLDELEATVARLARGDGRPGSESP